jgi:hypothetical protein
MLGLVLLVLELPDEPVVVIVAASADFSAATAAL